MFLKIKPNQTKPRCVAPKGLKLKITFQVENVLEPRFNDTFIFSFTDSTTESFKLRYLIDGKFGQLLTQIREYAYFNCFYSTLCIFLFSLSKGKVLLSQPLFFSYHILRVGRDFQEEATCPDPDLGSWNCLPYQAHIAPSEPMSSIDQQGSSLGSFPTFPSPLSPL